WLKDLLLLLLRDSYAAVLYAEARRGGAFGKLSGCEFEADASAGRELDRIVPQHPEHPENPFAAAAKHDWRIIADRQREAQPFCFRAGAKKLQRLAGQSRQHHELTRTVRVSFIPCQLEQVFHLAEHRGRAAPDSVDALPLLSAGDLALEQRRESDDA